MYVMHCLCARLNPKVTECGIFPVLIICVFGFVPSETCPSQSLCWCGPSGWEPAAQMSAVLQYSHPTYSSHGGPCLPQVCCAVTPCCYWYFRTDRVTLTNVKCLFSPHAASHCHWTLRFPKALLLCLNSTSKMLLSFCFSLCSKSDGKTVSGDFL